jgi:tetratricopeptide repeat protein/polysaccharide lyase family 4-like protein
LRYFAIGLLIGAAVGLASCQNTAPPPASSNAVSVDHSAEARNAFAARDWGKAAPHFRAAIAVDPGSLTLHHGLATCASWLGLLDEAKAEFNWVLAHAPAGSPEAQLAREWLASAETAEEATTTASADAPGSKVGDAAVHGLVTWEGPGHPSGVLPRAQIHLKGLPDGPTKGVSYYMRTDKEGRYRFDRIKAGQYRLTDAIAGEIKWNLRIEVKSGEDLALDLTPGNSVANRNDFPPAAQGARPTPPS